MGRRNGTLTLDGLRDLLGGDPPGPGPEPRRAPGPTPRIHPGPGTGPAPEPVPDAVARWTVRAGSRLEGMTASHVVEIAVSDWCSLDDDRQAELFQARLGRAQELARALMEDEAVGWVDVAYAWHGPMGGGQ